MAQKLNQIIVMITAWAILSGCDKSGQDERVGEFAIYLIRDTTLTVWEAEKLNLDELNLREKPFLTADNIATYSWSEHVVTVTPGFSSRLGELGMKYIRPWKPGTTPRKLGDQVFVVTVGSQRIYMGTFWPVHKSSIPGVPYVMTPIRPGGGSFKIEVNAFQEIEDPRTDDRIRESLKSAGVLRD